MLVGIVIVVIYIIGMNIYIVSGFRSGLIRNSNLLLKGVVETNIFTGLGSIRRLSMSKWDDNLSEESRRGQLSSSDYRGREGMRRNVRDRTKYNTGRGGAGRGARRGDGVGSGRVGQGQGSRSRRDNYNRDKSRVDGGYRVDRNRRHLSEVDKDGYTPVYGYYDGDHIYGIQPVRAALRSKRRTFDELIVQEGASAASKKDDTACDDIMRMAVDLEIPVKEYSKHDLNMLSGSRPHQGFVLRAAPLVCENIVELPSPDIDDTQVGCVLALDEVGDPMNFGALLRTAHFLGVDRVVVCQKNSAPLSPIVSKASAGAMELVKLEATNNMMRFLDASKENGWHVVGTSLGEGTIPLEVAQFHQPTILVLGNEGHGIRTNVLRRCDTLVKLKGKQDQSNMDVDSLNVSVTGGIVLHHILGKLKQAMK